MSKNLMTQQIDALVLAGGESRRMGSPKALLSLGGTTLLERVIGSLQPMFRSVLVVARERKGWDQLATAVRVKVLTDDRVERGPLSGLARGLAYSDASWCFLTGCDMPFLKPQVILGMTQGLHGCDILIPRVGGRLQPLHAFYAKGCLPYAEELLNQGPTSLVSLLPLCRVRTITTARFQGLDPHLLSFWDMDTRGDYQAAQRMLEVFSSQEVAP